MPDQLSVVVAHGQLLDVSEDLLHQQVDAIAQLYQQHSSASPSPPDVLSRAVHYAGLRAEAQKAEQVLAQFPGLDLERFTRDAQYRHATVLSLVQSPDAEQIAVAIPLATRYGLSTTTVYLERLKWLLRSSLSLQAIEAEVQGWKAQLMTSPKETYTALDAVFPLLDGRDLPRIRFLITLAEGCFQALETMTKERAVSSSPRKSATDLSIRVATDQLKVHRQVLDLLIRAPINVDYHRLLDRAQVEGALSEVVEEQNVIMMQGMADRLNQLLAASSPLPSFPALPVPSSPGGSSSPPSPIFGAGQSYVSSALIWRQFLSKSLLKCLNSPSSSLEGWFDTDPPSPLNTGTRFRQLPLLDACQIIVQTASVDHLPPPLTAERLIRHLTLVELGLRALPSVSQPVASVGADRAYDAVIGLQERLRVLVNATQLPSIVASPYFTQLCRSRQWRDTVRSLMMQGQEGGVQSADVKELIAILENEQSMQMSAYRQPPATAPWSVDALASEMFEEAREQLSEREKTPSVKAAISSLAALTSPVYVCWLYLEDSEGGVILRRLHHLMLYYWTQQLPADAVSEGGISLPLLLMLKALSGDEAHSLSPSLRASLLSVRPLVDEAIPHHQRIVLERLLQSAVHAEGAEGGVTAAQRATVDALQVQLDSLAPRAPTVYHSQDVCALMAATWENNVRTGGKRVPPAQWKALASLVSCPASLHVMSYIQPLILQPLTRFPRLLCLLSVDRLPSLDSAAGCVASPPQCRAERGGAADAVDRSLRLLRQPHSVCSARPGLLLPSPLPP